MIEDKRNTIENTLTHLFLHNYGLSLQKQSNQHCGL
jgi:hypothetical protein